MMKANASLRQAIESDNHRKAARQWLADLDAKYGSATPDEQTENQTFLEEIGFGDRSRDVEGPA